LAKLSKCHPLYAATKYKKGVTFQTNLPKTTMLKWRWRWPCAELVPTAVAPRPCTKPTMPVASMSTLSVFLGSYWRMAGCIRCSTEASGTSTAPAPDALHHCDTRTSAVWRHHAVCFFCQVLPGLTAQITALVTAAVCADTSAALPHRCAHSAALCAIGQCIAVCQRTVALQEPFVAGMRHARDPCA
jgi:hypothetical protein